MRTRSAVKTIKTVCGKTISYLQEEGRTARAHSTTGPAIVYSEEESKAPEYYLYGVKYSKQRWKEALSKTKTTTTSIPDAFDSLD